MILSKPQYGTRTSGIVTEPSFVLAADPNKYEPWDDLFYTSQQYIEKLRSNEGNYFV